jgi:hypothetical protein
MYGCAGSVVVELGCGSAQKTSILLNQLLARDGPEQASDVTLAASCILQTSAPGSPLLTLLLCASARMMLQRSTDQALHSSFYTLRVLKLVLFCTQVRFAGIDCSGAALDMAKTALLGSCEGLAARNITLVCKEYTEGECTGTQSWQLWQCTQRLPGQLPASHTSDSYCALLTSCQAPATARMTCSHFVCFRCGGVPAAVPQPAAGRPVAGQLHRQPEPGGGGAVLPGHDRQRRHQHPGAC